MESKQAERQSSQQRRKLLRQTWSERNKRAGFERRPCVTYKYHISPNKVQLGENFGGAVERGSRRGNQENRRPRSTYKVLFVRPLFDISSHSQPLRPLEHFSGSEMRRCQVRASSKKGQPIMFGKLLRHSLHRFIGLCESLPRKI